MSDSASGPARSPAIIDSRLIALDADLGSDKESVITALADRLTAAGRATDRDALAGAVLDRETKSATGLPGGIAIPHCRHETITTPSLGFARLSPKVDFALPTALPTWCSSSPPPKRRRRSHASSHRSGSRTRPARFRHSTPRRARARRRDRPGRRVLPAAPAAMPVGATAGSADRSQQAPEPEPSERSVVAVTACPTGIAHTYMAADALTAAAERAGVALHVETQGSSGSTPIPASVIAAADAVIFATDVGVKGKERFAGKPVIASGVKRAINEPDVMVAEALRAGADPNAPRVEAGATDTTGDTDSADLGWGTRLRQILLTGVSYMIPFVAAGGLLIALGFLFGGYDISDSASTIVVDNSLTNLPDGGLAIYLGAVLYQIGSLAFSFLVPALAGTSPTQSPTAPVSRPASPPVPSRCSSGPGSSAVWSAVSSLVSQPCGSVGFHCPRGHVG